MRYRIDVGREHGVEVRDIVNTTCPQAVPGIYGTADAIQVDKSRPPRLDELLASGVRTADIMQPGMTKVGTAEMGARIVEEIRRAGAA